MKIKTWTDFRYNEVIFQISITSQEVDFLEKAFISPSGYQGSISDILMSLAMAARLLEAREAARISEMIQLGTGNSKNSELPSG